MSYTQRLAAAWAAIFTAVWWTELREASVRQALQVVVPFLAVISTQGVVRADAVKATLLALAGGEVIVVVRRLAALTVPDDADLSTRLIARSLSAFAGAIAGYILVVPVADIFTLSWSNIIIASVSTTFLALLHGIWDPATTDALADAAPPAPIDREV
jgi:hypothetical protein